ncbi:hypothetical protein N7466_005598 [Penicillium verhagenii]|uniref:uncharacterized protein n=1 Tax=Penicillium verhagenii TaxID=1562060 RepID=UPI002545024C|nr:uncharacterized protein N7466_005598 [Penicillium verhagenii]KAJ5930105.1 hypothetical protein N7466_005598 [Penicillium verhagenii]
MEQSIPTEPAPVGVRCESIESSQSQTAREFINDQMRLEADAREILPYSFDSCTYSLGPLKQSLFACLTCNPSENNDDDSTDAGICYSCSIACHGEHTLVELFNKRNFVCDCGTTRMPATSPCTLREDPKTGRKGVHSQEAAKDNKYNQNFRNRFCGCGEQYDPHQEKGTMFQCLGLDSAEAGGCGEDWWHPECLIGLPRDWYKKNPDMQKPETFGGADGADDGADEENDEVPLPPGFPAEDDFDQFICFKCIGPHQWLRRYAGVKGILPPVFAEGGLNAQLPIKLTEQQSENTKKRKADDDESSSTEEPTAKRTKEASPQQELTEPPALATIPEEQPTTDPKEKPNPEPKAQESKAGPQHAFCMDHNPTAPFSLFLQEDFYSSICHCPECYSHLKPYPQLRELEETYEPPLSEDGNDGAASTGTGSILELGEAALSNVDRVRAIEGAMVYNQLRDKVKAFLRPFAESGTAVSAEDVKGYFEKLRGDEAGIKDAASRAETGGGGGENEEGDGRREQNGY